MEDVELKRSYSAIVTPTNGQKFKFPPDICASVDRLRDITNFHNILPSRRSFTPTRNAFYMHSPDISPIEFNAPKEYNFKRAPPEAVQKACADSTIFDPNDTVVDVDFTLMPPPILRPPRPSHEGLEAHIRQRRLDHFLPPDYINLHPVLRAQRGLKPKKLKSVRFKDDVMNAPVSLASLLKDTGLNGYIEKFEREEIDLEVLFTMTDDDLKRIGIESEVDRDTILKFKNIFFV
ncbi:unnamed protein product [Hermetia illucens]|uniref:SAM domain-containing protein n=2 Tax=Hermetia illucens TaxID=343691 RepID=A0A7R8Z0E4_HERIL|nr:unnamed protein product [Hermetia illucens]